MPNWPGNFDDSGQACERARDSECQEDQLVGVKSAEPCRPRRGADDANFESLDGAPQQHRRRGNDQERDDGAEMQTATFDQNRHGRDRIELGGGREVEARRVAPWPTHEIIEQEVGDIDQHQAGEDFAGAEPNLAYRRYQGIERACDGTEQQHRGQHPKARVGALRLHREPATGDGPDQELSFGPDIPGVGEITQRQADRDHHQRARLHGDFLQRISVGQGIDEVDDERRNRILAKDDEQDAHGHDGEADRDQRRNQRNRVRSLGALLKHQLHAPLPFRPGCFRPSAGQAFRGWLRWWRAAAKVGHETSPRSGR